MIAIRRLAVLGVVAAGVTTAFSIDDRRNAPSKRPDSIETPAGVRSAERSRRAERPADAEGRSGATYDQVFNGRTTGVSEGPKSKPAPRMPPTACRAVETAPKDGGRSLGPHWVHDRAISMFENAAGFGFSRMVGYANERGKLVPAPAVDRVELVSLLTDYEPSVYVLDEMATPPLARQAKRRPLDEFERRGLEAVRRGENLVWTREAPTRMFGAIRAKANCFECHAGAKEGDLLGAFTYYLTTPVDQLGEKCGAD
jgi:hypothetical protein